MATVPIESPVAPYQAADLAMPGEQILRFSTAGSVDDGKSTLIGCLPNTTASLSSKISSPL